MKGGCCVKRVPSNKIPDDIAIQVCKDYQDYPLKYVANKYGISEPTVIHICKRMGYSGHSRRKHRIDESYFSIIDTPNKAYILGYFMADVCICKTTKQNHFANRIILNVSCKDKDMLISMLQEFESNIEVTDFIPQGTYSSNTMSKFVINSVTMCKDLAKYGVVERRTPIKCIPDNLSEEMLPHFIRGLFDGDGSCILTSTHNGYRRSVSFTSQSLTLLQQLKDLFTNLGCKSVANIFCNSRDKNAYTIAWYHTDDIKIWYNYMYPEGNYLYLARKREKFLI